MFDIGFFELVLVAIVGLLVLGPEKLPHAVRMTSAFLGKIRRSAIEIQAQIESELDTKELQKQIKAGVEKSMEDTGLDQLQQDLEQPLIESSSPPRYKSQKRLKQEQEQESSLESDQASAAEASAGDTANKRSTE